MKGKMISCGIDRSIAVYEIIEIK